MTIISIFISVVFFLNQSLAGIGNASQFELAFEKKLHEAVGRWNQAADYGEIIAKLPATNEERTLIKQKFLKLGLIKTKPLRVNYLPNRKQFIIETPHKKVPVFLLSTFPSVKLYDGQTVFEIMPKSSIKFFWLESGAATTPTSNKSKPHKTAFWPGLLIPAAKAQSTDSAAYWTAIQEQNKKLAADQTQFVKKLLFIGIFAFAGCFALTWLWGSYAHLLNPEWGQNGKAKAREDNDWAKSKFPEVEKKLFNSEEKVVFALCTSGDKNSPLAKITFKNQNGQETIYDFAHNNPSMDAYQKQLDARGEMVKQADSCCQHRPCGNMMAAKLVESYEAPVEEASAGSVSEENGPPCGNKSGDSACQEEKTNSGNH